MSVFYLVIVLFSGCESPQEVDLARGLNLQSRGDLREAIAEFEKVTQRNPGNEISLRAARESAKILLYDLKNYLRAIEELRFIVLYSKSQDERWKSQAQIAQIYFDNLAWYDKALVEYSKLLTGSQSKGDRLKIKLAIARSYYYLGQFSQSWSEASDILLDTDGTEEQQFDVLLLQANIHLALKKYGAAAEALEQISLKFPIRSKKENVGLNLVLCYEELGSLKDALRVLESLKEFYEPKDYIVFRIKKIKDRYLNQPKKRLKK